MMKILVTGAEGQLGRSIQDLAKKHNHLDFIFTDYDELDITNSTKVYDFFKGDRFDYCINCAAYTAVDKAESETKRAFEINAEGVNYLAQSCKLNNIILIHISTDFVFDGNKQSPYTELDVPNPINVYGLSKLKGEEYVQTILEKYYIVRTSWVYSEFGQNFLKTMIKLSGERDEIGVVNDQIGSPTYAIDLAGFIISLVKDKIKEYGIYNYSNKGTISWYDFAIEIFRQQNLPITINPISSLDYETPAKRPKNSKLDLSHTMNTFQNEIPNWDYSLRECLKRVN